jgi:hypothetical protein
MPIISLREWLDEHFLTEDDEHPDPFEATWAKHGPAIMARAKEIRHFEVRANGSTDHTIHPGQPHHDEKTRAPFENLAKHFQNGESEKEFPGGHVQPGHRLNVINPNERITVRPSYTDNHPAASLLRDAAKNAADPKVPQDTEYAKTAQGLAKDQLKQTIVAAAPRAKYIPKIMKMYANGSIERIEDIGTQAKEAFAKYDKLVTQGHIRTDLKLEGTTIGHHQLKKMDSLRQIQDVVNHPAYAEHLKEPAPKPKEGEYSIVHEDDDVTVYQPHTHDASVALAHCPHTGKKASWCIAAGSKEGAMLFDEKNEHDTPYPGAKFYFHPKKPQRPGELHAVVPLANEYRDEHDDEVPYSEDHRDGGIQNRGSSGARYPGFGHAEIMAATHKHAYENPELYTGEAREGMAGGFSGFRRYIDSRNPNHDKSLWRQKTPEERDRIGNSSAKLFDTVPKDADALRKATIHHNHVLHHFWPPEEPDPDDYNEDR